MSLHSTTLSQNGFWTRLFFPNTYGSFGWHNSELLGWRQQFSAKLWCWCCWAELSSWLDAAFAWGGAARMLCLLVSIFPREPTQLVTHCVSGTLCMINMLWKWCVRKLRNVWGNNCLLGMESTPDTVDFSPRHLQIDYFVYKIDTWWIWFCVFRH